MSTFPQIPCLEPRGEDRYLQTHSSHNLETKRKTFRCVYLCRTSLLLWFTILSSQNHKGFITSTHSLPVASLERHAYRIWMSCDPWPGSESRFIAFHDPTLALFLVASRMLFAQPMEARSSPPAEHHEQFLKRSMGVSSLSCMENVSWSRR